MGFPISWLMSFAYRSARSRRMAASRCIGTARSANDLPRQARKASCACPSASSTWSAVCGSNVARISSVAGLTLVMGAVRVAMARLLLVHELVHGLEDVHLDAG